MASREVPNMGFSDSDDEVDDVPATEGALRFTKYTAQHPFVVCCGIFSFLMLLAVFLVMTSIFALTDPDNRHYMVKTDERVANMYAFEEAQRALRDKDELQPVRSTENSAWSVTIMYAGKSGADMLTQASLQTIRDWESWLVNHDQYQRYCYAGEESPACHSSASAITLSTLYNVSWDEYEIGNATADYAQRVTDVVNGVGAEEDSFLPFYFDKNFDNVTGKSPFVRSVYNFGTPPGRTDATRDFKNQNDDIKGQRKAFSEWMTDFVDYARDNENANGISVLVTSRTVWDLVFLAAMVKDMLWAFGSIMFVLVFISWHCRSIFLGCAGLAGILLAFPAAFAVYRSTGISFYSTLHLIMVFLMLGIGADDIFVFYDAFQQGLVEISRARGESPDNYMIRRLDWAWRRASRAMLVTSVTTSAAFFTTSMSRVMPISSFGLWSGILVMVNYAIVITMFPAAVVIWSRYFEGHKWCYCCCLTCDYCCWQSPDHQCCEVSNRIVTRTLPAHLIVSPKEWNGALESYSESQDALSAERSSISAREVVPNSADNKNQGFGCEVDCKATTGIDSEGQGSENVEDDCDDSDPFADINSVLGRYGKVERCCDSTWSSLIYRVRYVAIIVFLGIFGLAVFYASRIEPPSEREQWLPDDHWLTIAWEHLSTFRSSIEDENVQLDMVWGVKRIDNDDVDFYDPDDVGTIVWDADFDLSAPDSQNFILNACTQLRSESSTLETRCFMETFRDWRLSNGWNFPANFSNDPTAQKTAFDANFTDFFTNDNDGKQHRIQSDIGVNSGGDVRCVRVKVFTSIKLYQPGKTMEPLWRMWENVVDNINNGAPNGLDNMFQASQEGWTWFPSEEEFVRSAITGMFISCGVAFGALVISTWNVWISVFATFSIVGIVSCVTAGMVIMGWTLGIGESVVVVILVGFSVDYTVHICNSYVEAHVSPHKVNTLIRRGAPHVPDWTQRSIGEGQRSADRYLRMREALREMGISVLSGCITTVGASLFLWPCTTLFFRKFAILMLMTACLSLAWATVFFVGVSFAVGPTGSCCNVVLACNRLRLHCVRRCGCCRGMWRYPEEHPLTRRARRLTCGKFCGCVAYDGDDSWYYRHTSDRGHHVRKGLPVRKKPSVTNFQQRTGYTGLQSPSSRSVFELASPRSSGLLSPQAPSKYDQLPLNSPTGADEGFPSVAVGDIELSPRTHQTPPVTPTLSPYPMDDIIPSPRSTVGHDSLDERLPTVSPVPDLMVSEESPRGRNTAWEDAVFLMYMGVPGSPGQSTHQERAGAGAEAEDGI